MVTSAYDGKGGLNYEPFNGDGRMVLKPVCVLPGTQPSEHVTRATARLIIDSLMAIGSTTHSEQGATLWVCLAWLQRHGLHYVLEAKAGAGYQIRLVTSGMSPQESSLQQAYALERLLTNFEMYIDRVRKAHPDDHYLCLQDMEDVETLQPLVERLRKERPHEPTVPR